MSACDSGPLLPGSNGVDADRRGLAQSEASSAEVGVGPTLGPAAGGALGQLGCAVPTPSQLGEQQGAWTLARVWAGCQPRPPSLGPGYSSLEEEGELACPSACWAPASPRK